MNIARSFNSWRKYRQTVTELDRMSNRELHDLGIDRSDIRRVARQAVGFLLSLLRPCRNGVRKPPLAPAWGVFVCAFINRHSHMRRK